ncbi:MAG: protein-L-isoaspartate O-methyltransferase [Alphaproteobacteria bacterium]|nr:protein-L-isoaspartate O-methyltransferase [Alphaproteobacteria bacterium]
MNDLSRARKAMVDSQLCPNGITSRALLDAMGTVPREMFVAKELGPLAYIDEDFPIPGSSPTRYLIEPMPFARLVQLAEIGPNDIVLDVGCATGYTTAVLAALAGSVVAIDDQPKLVEQAVENLIELDVGNAAAVTGELAEGLASEAPFDVIIVEGAVEDIPPSLLAQLRQRGGRLVAIKRDGAASRGTLWVRSGDDYSSREAFDAAIPRLPQFSRKPEFQF